MVVATGAQVYTWLGQATAMETPAKRKHTEFGRSTPEKTRKDGKLQRAAALAKCLRESHVAVFKKVDLVKKSAGNTSTAPGTVNDAVFTCFVCGRAKHECAWLYKQAGHKGTRRTVTGGQCSACFKACRLLRTSRSESLLRTHGVLSFVCQVSQKVCEERGADDAVKATQ
ncbi:unnamed protein product [Durusdinium trenchii]|uniref:Uncharacterized protein n=1 Tax=Durusdinium trenchii TaxID=1381693 RepID=A0ABP0ICF0_9DINO